MKHVVASLALLFAIGAAAFAQDSASSGVAVQSAWARATPPGARTGAVYMTLVNNGKAADRLVGASTPVAARAELHTTIDNKGVMEMRPLPHGVALKPGATAMFKPGGMHVMLMGLKHPLKEGESFPVTFDFAKAGKQEVRVTIAKIGAMGKDEMGDMKGMDKK